MAKPNRKLPTLTTQDINRFQSKVSKAPGQGPNGDCWEWQGARVKGYGTLRICRKDEGIRINIKAHRVAYFLATGRDLGLSLGCHHCDNPPCCNPSHLFRGTHKKNTHDAIQKGRMNVPHNAVNLMRGDAHWTRTPDGRKRAAEHLASVKRVHGERQHSAKLTGAKVRRARIRYAKGTTIQKLSKDYGISWISMSKVVKRITWKHIN